MVGCLLIPKVVGKRVSAAMSLGDEGGHVRVSAGPARDVSF